MKDPLEALKETFFQESQEILVNLEELLIELDQCPENKELLQSIFRQVHTLKGASGMLEEFYSIETLAHSQEDLLDALRHGELELSQEIRDLGFQVLDLFKKLLNDAREGRRELPAEYPEVLEKLKAISKNLMEPEGGGQTAGIGGRGPEVGSAPQTSSFRLTGQGSPPPDPEETFWSKLGRLEGEVQKETEQGKEIPGTGKKPGEILKVTSEKLDHLLDQVGELVISYTLVSQNPSISGILDPHLQREISHLGKIIQDFQSQVMSLRMVSLAQTFQKMKRIARDAARKTGKEVELRISGGEAELDKTVMEQMGDLLVHLIRNAVAHGIEPPEERERIGKPRQGTVWLQAQPQRGSVVIEVRDDGKGISREGVLQKAREIGLLPDGTDLTDQQVLKMILLPGFSTARDVSALSGRGVGLDVVKKRIQDLRGKLDIQSVEGKGTSIKMTLPLTLAIIDGMGVKVGCQRYILPLVFIERSLRPQREEIFTIQGEGEVVKVEGNLVPVIRLHELWELEPERENLWEGLVVVVRDGKRRGGLFVDDLLGQQQVVIKELGGLGGLKGISGGTILGDGTVGLILDVEGILEMTSHESQSKTFNPLERVDRK